MPELTAGRFGRTQLVALELAVLAAAAALVVAPPQQYVLAGAAAVIMFGALGRVGGRWVYEAVAARWRLRGRNRMPHSGLAAVTPELSITTYVDRGTPIGIGHDRLGWFAAVSIVSAHRVALQVEWLAWLLSGFSVPVTSVQLVTRRLPLVGPQDETAITAASYRELLGLTPAPAVREMWIAVRLSPADAVQAAAERGGEVAGVHRALSAAVARIGTSLTAAGVGHIVPDATTLQRIITVACGMESPEPAQERWGAWHASGRVHLSFAVRSLPAEPHPDLLSELERVPAALASHSAVLLRPNGSGAPGVRLVVRFVTTPQLAAECAHQAHEVARRLGVRLVRLNGEQATGVYATSPSGAVQGLRPW